MIAMIHAWAQPDSEAAAPGPCAVWMDMAGGSSSGVLDGVPDHSETYAYDEDGELLSVAWDYHNDGSVDATTYYQYLGHGPCRLPALAIAFDSCPEQTERMRADGSVDTSVVLAFDETGRLASMDETQIFTGGRENQVWHGFEYDTEGRIQATWRESGSLVVERTVLTYLDGSAQPAQAEREVGALTQSITFTYDEHGRLLLQEIDTNGDGVPDGRNTYDYTCWEAPPARWPWGSPSGP